MTFPKALAEVLSKAGIPYGYTLAIWSTGALCIGRFGLPTAAQVFLFVAGASVAYAGLALIVGRHRVVRATRPPAALWENVFAVPAVGVTYGIDGLISSAEANFFVSPLAATVVYLLGLALLVSRVTAREERELSAGDATPGSSEAGSGRGTRTTDGEGGGGGGPGRPAPRRPATNVREGGRRGSRRGRRSRDPGRWVRGMSEGRSTIGVVGWALLVGALFVWEGIGLLRKHDGWPTLSEIARAAMGSPIGRLALFALWLWLGVHLFVRGWRFFLQE